MTDRMPTSNFEQLVLGYVDTLFAVALQLTHDPADAHDLTQEALAKALHGHGGFDGDMPVKAWLLKLLRNTFVADYGASAQEAACGCDCDCFDDLAIAGEQTVFA
jgi:RNA polymerase sigma factor (sigma-70 family)